MPSTIQITVSMQNANNFATESLSDTFTTQYGRHSDTFTDAGVYNYFTWPSTGETMLYVKFPQQATSYTIDLTSNVTSIAPQTITIPAGTGFTPVMLPQPPITDTFRAYWAVRASVSLPALPLFYF